MTIASRWSRLAAVTIAGAAAGCAAVDAHRDFEQTNQYISRATGQPSGYRPGDDAIIDAKVESLLAKGVTVDEAVQICLLNNRDLQAAWMDIGMAKADLVQAGLLSNPTVGFFAKFPAGGGLADIDATLAQNIADLWQIGPRKRVAQHALDAAILDLANRAAGLAADAKSAYYKAVGAHQALEIAEENRGIVQRLLDLSLVRQRAGAGTDVDVNLSRGPVLDAERAILVAKLEEREDRRVLAKLLGLKGDPNALVLNDALPALPGAVLDSAGLIEVARAERLDLKSAAQAVDGAAAKVQQQWRAIFPNVTLGVDAERQQRKAEPRRHVVADTARATIANGTLTAPDIQPKSDRHRAASRDRNLAYITGPTLNLEIPVFDQNQAQIAKAVSGYRQAVKAYESLDRGLEQDVRGAVDRAVTAWELAQFYHNRSGPLAQRNLELSQRSFQAGKASLLEVLELQKFVLQTRNDYVQALQDASGRIAELERTVGLPMSEIVKRGGVADSQPASSQPASMPAGRP